MVRTHRKNVKKSEYEWSDRMKNLMNITDLTIEEIDELVKVAEDIIANPVKYQDACRHKLLATDRKSVV